MAYEKDYPIPKIVISDITAHSFKINASYPVGDLWYLPSYFELDVYNTTFGTAFTAIEQLVLQRNELPYTVTGLYGGDSLYVSLRTIFLDGQGIEVERWYDNAELTTPLIPITSIELKPGISDTLTIATSSGVSDHFSYENLIIHPNIDEGDADNASVLDGARKKIEYSFSGSGDIAIYQNMPNSLPIANFGGISGHKRGVCTVKIAPADKVNEATASLYVTVIVEQTVTDLLIDPAYIQINLADGNVTIDNVTVLPDDANEKGLTYSSDDISILTVNSSGVITPISAGVTTILITSKDVNNPISKVLTVEVVNVANIWHEGYNQCPAIMNTIDFNSIVDNAAYIGNNADTTGLSLPTLTKATPNDDFSLSKGKFENLFTYVKTLLQQSSTYIGNLTTDPSEITTSFIYAPAYSQWNILLGCINDAKAYLDTLP